MTVALTDQRSLDAVLPAGRGPGCADQCITIVALIPGVFGRREVILHDPATHEAHGRTSTVSRVVKTGPLVVDLDHERVYVDGREIALSRLQYGILAHLTRQAGRLCPPAAILVEVWGPSYLDADRVFRVTLSRLRQSLGAAGCLIETRAWRGYCLRLVQPEQPETVTLIPLPRRTWSKRWDACQACGETTRPHYAHGLCGACANRAKREQRAGVTS